MNAGTAGAVMGVGMADAGGANTDQGVAGTDGGHRGVVQLQGLARFNQTNSFHGGGFGISDAGRQLGVAGLREDSSAGAGFPFVGESEPEESFGGAPLPRCAGKNVKT